MFNMCVNHQTASLLQATSVWFAFVSVDPGTKIPHLQSWSSDCCHRIACLDAHCLPTICYQTVPRPKCLPTHSIKWPALDHMAVPTYLHNSLSRKVWQWQWQIYRFYHICFFLDPAQQTSQTPSQALKKREISEKVCVSADTSTSKGFQA